MINSRPCGSLKIIYPKFCFDVMIDSTQGSHRKSFYDNLSYRPWVKLPVFQFENLVVKNLHL